MLNEDALKEFIFDCQLRKLSKRTVSSYKNANLRMMKFIKEEYGIDELEDTHHQAIKGYIQYLINQGLSEVYINRNIVCYKCYFRYCMEEGYINRNPMDKIKKQKEAVRLIETFTNDEVARLLKVFRGANFLDIRNH